VRKRQRISLDLAARCNIKTARKPYCSLFRLRDGCYYCRYRRHCAGVNTVTLHHWATMALAWTIWVLLFLQHVCSTVESYNNTATTDDNLEVDDEMRSGDNDETQQKEIRMNTPSDNREVKRQVVEFEYPSWKYLPAQTFDASPLQALRRFGFVMFDLSDWLRLWCYCFNFLRCRLARQRRLSAQ
jgi:hypothetical protein